MLEITTFQRGDADTVLLAYVGTGSAVPEEALNSHDYSTLIPSNYRFVDRFEKDPSLSGDYTHQLQDPSMYYEGTKNSLLISPYAIFEGTFTTDPNQLEPLPYYHEMKFEHISSSQTPYKSILLFDNNGIQIPRQYYKTYIETSYRIENTYTGAGNTYGPFILQQSQIDLARARAALGENIWGEPYGTTSIEEHRVWENINKELLRPPYDTVNLDPNIPSGYLSRIDDGRYSRDEFMGFYIDDDGRWGQALSGEYVVYTDVYGESHTWGKGLSGQLGTVQTIQLLQSEKYLDGDWLYPPNVALRITLLLPEFLVHQDNLTLWAQYNKYVEYDLSGQTVVEYEPNYREIINPQLVMQEDIDYTVLKNNDQDVQFTIDANFEARWGAHSYYYVKRNRDKAIKLIRPRGGEKDAWFAEVQKGHFKTNTVVYQTYNLVDSQGHARDWYQGSVVPVLTEFNNTVHKIVKEQAQILDHRTIKVRHTPIYFWNGPRDTTRDSTYGYFINETDEAVFDTGENADPDNPWPRYIPPNLIDWHSTESYRFYPNDPTSKPDYSHGITIYRNGTRINNNTIDTWDLWNGLIVFKEAIQQDDVYEVTYLTEENRAVLPSLNLNPHYPERLYEPSGQFTVEGL